MKVIYTEEEKAAALEIQKYHPNWSFGKALQEHRNGYVASASKEEKAELEKEKDLRTFSPTDNKPSKWLIDALDKFDNDIGQKKTVGSSISGIATDIGQFVEEKNKGYGNSFDKTEKFLMSLYPNGIQPDQFSDAICSMRIFDKLSKLSSGNGDKFDENIYEDLMGVVLRMSLNNLGGEE